ncbi:hypothetical protein VIGAN_04028100 [Vigna angularis var. angularis]|uniref:Uncharacterized protein n=1 Tax=Vigna angularis var. angularis TaxID=157739 RepID=A0A0S3RRJ3_PHAAN|nr:hypothetical protein VIGAN_04028100 [Vigna angularis var. angularis]
MLSYYIILIFTFLGIICLGIKCFFEGIFLVEMFLGALCSCIFSPLGRLTELTEPHMRNKRQVIFLQIMLTKKCHHLVMISSYCFPQI